MVRPRSRESKSWCNAHKVDEPGSRWRESRQRRVYRRLPPWGRVLAFTIVLLSWGFACSAALAVGFHPGGAIGALAGVSGGLLAQRQRDQEYRSLDRTSQDQIREVQRTGRPSGDARLDRIAVARLSRRVRTTRADRVIGPIVVAACIGVPIAAAIRSTPWWLLDLIPALFATERAIYQFRNDPRPRLERLQATLSQQ